MTTVSLVHVVQDTDSGLFMFPHEGDVGYTKLIKDAGAFDDIECAIETAMFHLGHNFIVFSFYRQL